MSLKTSPRLAALNWSHLVSWCWGRGGCPSWQQSPGCAQCLCCALWGRRKASFCRGQTGITMPSQPGVPALSAACWGALCRWHLIQFSPVRPPWWHHSQWHSELGITALWLMARTFPLLGKLSCYLSITSWTYHHRNYLLFCRTSVWWKTSRRIPPTRAVFPNDLQKNPDLFWLECYFLSLFMQFLLWKCVGGKDNCLILSFAPFKICMRISTLSVTKTMWSEGGLNFPQGWPLLRVLWLLPFK